MWLAVDGCTWPVEPHAIQTLIAALVASRRVAYGAPPGSSWWEPPPQSPSTPGSGEMPQRDLEPPGPGWIPVPLGRREFRHAMEDIKRRLMALELILRREGDVIVATQADIDALAQQVSDLQAKVTADDSQLQSGIAAVQAWIAAQPENVDVTGLQSALSTLASGVDAVGADADAVASLVPPATS